MAEKSRLIRAGTVLALMLPWNAGAQGGLSADKVLQRMDANNDGQVTRAEWKGKPPAFGRIDQDGNGTLTRSELDAFFGGGGGPAQGAKGPAVAWVDVHTHPAGGRGADTDHPGAMQDALDTFDATPSLIKMVLMPPPQVSGRKPPGPMEDFLDLAKPHPDKFDVMGGGGSLNDMIHTASHDGHVTDELRAKFRARAEEILAKGAVGFGEVSALHLALVANHPYEDVPADHPLLLELADVAGAHGVPIDIHFDPVIKSMKAPKWMAVPPNPPHFKPNLDAFERFVAHNRGAKISWAHAGSDQLGHWTVELTRRMLSDHPNLYMSLRMAPGRAPQNHPMTARGIKPEWMAVFTQFSDRFMIGNDQFFVSQATTGGAAVFAKQAGRNRERTVRFLSYLPPKIARQIGHENARRVYGISLPLLK